MRTLRTSRAVVIVTTLVLCGNDGPVHAAPPPAWQFKAGETLRYRLTIRSDAEMQSAGVVHAVPKKSGLSLALVLSWTVNRVAADGTAELTQKIEHARFTIYREDGIQNEALYDSGDPATINNQWSGMMDLGIRPLLNAPYFLKIDRHGRPVEVKRPEGVVKAWKELAAVFEDKEIPFAPMFTANGFIALLSPVLARASNPSGSADSWTYSWGEPESALQLTDTYTPTDSGRSLRKYVGKTKAVLRDPTAPPTITPPPIAFPTSLTWGNERVQFRNGRIESQSGTATLTFDQEAGHLVEFSRDLAYRAAIDFQVGPERPQNNTATGSYKLTAGLVLLPKQP